MQILHEVFIDNKYTLFLISLLGFGGNISKINVLQRFNIKNAINMTLGTPAQLDFKVSI